MIQNQDNKQPLVSIVTPTYNRADYLKLALNCAVNQSYQNIEIIISDNCSTDNTQEVVESFKDPRIRYIRQPKNIGMFANNIYVFKVARGKYVASLHDDDIWHEDFLTSLVRPLEENPDLIMSFCDEYIIDEHGEINDRETEKFTRLFKRDIVAPGIHKQFDEIGLIYKSIPSSVAAVIRNMTEFWVEMPEEVGSMWDLYLTYMAICTGMGVYYEPERLMYYRVHMQSDTRNNGRREAQIKINKAKNEIFCYQRFVSDPVLNKCQPYFQARLFEAYTTLAIGMLLSQEIEEARSYLWRAISGQKFNLRTLAAFALSFTPQPLANLVLGVSK